MNAAPEAPNHNEGVSISEHLTPAVTPYGGVGASKIPPLRFFCQTRQHEADSVGAPRGLKAADGCFTASSIGVEGPPRSGRTTLLFQYALNIAELGHRVVFFCEQGKLLRQPPTPEQDIQGTSERVLHRIELKYTDTVDSIVASLARLQELPEASRPTVILVDDFDMWYRSDTLAAIHALAVLESTVQWLAQSADPAGIVPHFLVSYAQPDFPIQRWLKLVGKVTMDIPSRACVLTITHSPASNAWLHADANPYEAKSSSLAYTLTDQRLVFQQFKVDFASE